MANHRVWKTIPSRIVPFLNAVCCTKCRVTADTDVIADLCTEGIIKKLSDPDLSLPQPCPSTGSKFMAVIKDSLPNCISDPVQNTGENSPVTAEQCNIANNLAKPHDLTVTTQLNSQDIKLLVDTGAGMSVIAEQDTRRLKDELPKLQKGALVNVKTVSGEELPVLGKIKVILGIAEGKYPCELQVVKNLTYKVVLGRDFLTH